MDETCARQQSFRGAEGRAPNEENEPETKSIRFVPSAYDPRGIEQWLLSARRRGSSCSATTIL